MIDSTTDLIKRDMLGKLKDQISKKEISLIVGSRQIGKTTLMKLLQSWLEEQGINTLYLSLDIQADKEFFGSQESLLDKLELEFGREKGYVFIDEIQRKENAGLFLKGIYDRDLNHKLIVSGSGSLELKEKIHESLVGRKRVFELSPVTFKEFIDYRTNYSYSDSLFKYFDVEANRAKRLLEEYMNFGGYPRVVTSRKEKEKRRVIDEIFNSYLERDITNLLNVKKIDAFSQLVSLLADQIGGLVSYSKLSRNIGIEPSTVRNYLEYLEKTFVINKIDPFFSNKRKEIVKSSVVYFSDLGLRNFSIDRFGSLGTSTEKGQVFECFVFNLLDNKLGFTGYSINYWRTKSGAEVDFVLNKGAEVLPVEAKYKQDPKVSRSLRSFIEKYEPEEAWIINLDKEEETFMEETKINFIPYYKVALSDNLSDLMNS